MGLSRKQDRFDFAFLPRLHEEAIELCIRVTFTHRLTVPIVKPHHGFCLVAAFAAASTAAATATAAIHAALAAFLGRGAKFCVFVTRVLTDFFDFRVNVHEV